MIVRVIYCWSSCCTSYSRWFLKHNQTNENAYLAERKCTGVYITWRYLCLTVSHLTLELYQYKLMIRLWMLLSNPEPVVQRCMFHSIVLIGTCNTQYLHMPTEVTRAECLCTSQPALVTAVIKKLQLQLTSNARTGCQEPWKGGKSPTTIWLLWMFDDKQCPTRCQNVAWRTHNAELQKPTIGNKLLCILNSHRATVNISKTTSWYENPPNDSV